MKDKEILKLLKANWQTRIIAAYLQVPINRVYKIKRENIVKTEFDQNRDFYYG